MILCGAKASVLPPGFCPAFPSEAIASSTGTVISQRVLSPTQPFPSPNKLPAGLRRRVLQFHKGLPYHNDVTIEELLVQYEDKLQKLQAGLLHTRSGNTVAVVVFVASTALFIILGVFAMRQQLSFLCISLPLPLAAASTQRIRRYRHSRNRMFRLQGVYGRAVQRLKNNWARNGIDGREFCRSAHAYARDLNIFGEGSLFELLCTVRTAIGQRGLAEYLLRTPALEETLLRQEAIRELTDRTDLREGVALLGEFEFLQSKRETFEEWLRSPPLSVSKPLRILALINSTTLASMVLIGFATSLVQWSTLIMWMVPILAFQSIIGLLFHDRVIRMLGCVQPLSGEVQVLRHGLQLLEAQQFRSVKLFDLAERVRNSSRAVRKLERLLNALGERNKPWFYGPSLFLLFGTQVCMAIETWRNKHGGALRVWLDVWAEFEALNALATYAYENPTNTFPEFTRDGARFEAEDLGNPLLSRHACIRNDIQLNDRLRFYILSGSNMSGKSTLLRAIGLNAVLAFAGAPVRAKSLRLAPLSVWASMSVVDSLLDGKSKFLAEIDRLLQTLKAAETGETVLFLVDEIFSGTNSPDRRIAAEAVVRTLVSRGAIGALSTHDIALTEIAAKAELRGRNVHMGSRGGGDPMDFDYRLKQGVTDESNALAIARMAGVPV
jgi:MutS domain V